MSLEIEYFQEVEVTENTNNLDTRFQLAQLGGEIPNEFMQYRVLRVVDGDSIVIDVGGKHVNIRMIGIDAPEISEVRFGYRENLSLEAKAYLQNLIGWNTVSIELDQSQGFHDNRGRLLAYIFVNGVNLNNAMVRAGYAKEFTYKMPYKYIREFKESEGIARTEKLNLWDYGVEKTGREFFKGPQGGCYYVNGNDNKQYGARENCEHLP